MPSAEAIRATLEHPVVDADGHQIEFLPLLADFVEAEAGRSVRDHFDLTVGSAGLIRDLDDRTRRSLGLSRTGWWALPAANTLDRATAMLPHLLHSRLDELGIDVALMYPTAGLMVMALDDDELRGALARAFNRYCVEVFAGTTDRLMPVGVIPTYSPREALAELEWAHQAGLRAFLFGGLVLRPTPDLEAARSARWVDGLGLDSAHDYDPLWQRCDELGVSPTFHSTGIGFGSRTSPTNYVANHIGNFAAGNEAVARSLLLGGAMTRFARLRWAFLEGGVTWALSLRSDTIGHFDKRNRVALDHYDPRRLDREFLARMVVDHGAEAVRARVARIDESLGFLSDPDDAETRLDEFAPTEWRSTDEIVAAFERCSFGCEADDPTVGLGFARSFGPKLRAMFASDIGHWDVPDFRGVLGEAYELVELGHLDPTQFRAFTFDHVVDHWTATNPGFFDGTVVAADVRAR